MRAGIQAFVLPPKTVFVHPKASGGVLTELVQELGHQ